MTDHAQRIDRGRRAAQALEEFLDPAFDEVIASYTARMREIVAREPWEIEKIKALVMAQRIAEEARHEISLLVKDAEAARREATRVEQVASLPAARRKALGV
jgi:hypothetical protein